MNHVVINPSSVPPWSVIEFSKAVTDTTGGQTKVQKKDYLPSGLVPVVDQGLNLIAGYTDDSTHSYTGELPVMLFDDHTRIFKYIDFSFALGADGVKVLQPVSSLLPKFLHYYFKRSMCPVLVIVAISSAYENARCPCRPIAISKRVNKNQLHKMLCP